MSQTGRGIAADGFCILSGGIFFRIGKMSRDFFSRGDGALRNFDNNQKVSDVQIGQVKAGRGKVILQSKAIGSCVAIVAYDATKQIGALAHVMLPGRAPEKKAAEKTKYAANAIDAIVNKMAALGSKTDDIEIALVGGGNILNRKDDTICNANIKSTLKLVGKKGLKVRAQALGGTVRRSVWLDVERGIVSYTEGNSREKQLWRAKKSSE